MTKNCADVKIYENITKDFFVSDIQVKRKPTILRGLDIGDCVVKWTPQYLIEQLGNVDVKIHVCTEGKMDFINKNFVYKTLPLGELIKRATRETQTDYFLSCKEFYYLRSLSSERRGREVADISKQFPKIRNDIKIPQFFEESDYFSSVLRIGSAGVQLWTHYDIMDNMLIQVQGRKHVVLFNPSDVPYLYLNGDKSEVLDIDNYDTKLFPKFSSAIKHECLLEPGDILFIPALWFHNTHALTYGIAVNVFWKNLQHDLYDKNDFYGNKDLVPASKALQSVENAVKLLQQLPNDYKEFYIQRAILNLEKHLPAN